ncbi:MAG: hypothetical protein CL472_02505 [Acidobacteria bacterium]|nr:hypothetical protein [Acidobacteriota bacterium]
MLGFRRLIATGVHEQRQIGKFFIDLAMKLGEENPAPILSKNLGKLNRPWIRRLVVIGARFKLDAIVSYVDQPSFFRPFNGIVRDKQWMHFM